ncbi:MAG: histidine phosphatase family protein [Clostridia bacterium]|nr:histidine phosphatase family protein [Clostridia bacterium]
MKTYQIHLLRHGITDGNIQGQYIGSKDVPLNDLGIENIRALDENFIYPGAAAYFTSPMQRCKQTLGLIYPDVRPIVIEEFRECDFGEFEGLTAEELSGSEDFAKWLASDGHAAPPSGESGVAFGRRVCQAFEKIVGALLETGTPSAVIMTHGGAISTLLAQYGLPEAGIADWAMDPGCGYSVRIHPQLWTAARKVEVYQRIPLPREEEEWYESEYFIADAPEGEEEAGQEEESE